MDKINFQNLPNTTTPVNASNLNLLQDNVDNAKVEKSTTLSTTDLNNLTNTTELHYCTGATNRPISSNGWVVSIKYSSVYTKQFYYPVNSNVSYERLQINGTWGDWKIVGGEEVYSIASYLKNSWSVNGYNGGIVLPNGTKILTVSIRRGTDTLAMTLPSNLRPSGTVLATATNGTAVGLVTINTDGDVTVGSSIYTSGSSNCIFSVMYQ